MLMKVLKTLSCIGLLIAISSAALPSNASSSSHAVLDVYGRPLVRGAQYTVKFSQDRSLTFGPENPQLSKCPLFVSLGNNDPAEPGYPVVFEPFAEGETVVREGSDFHIYFNAVTDCKQSSFWNVNVTEPNSGRRLILLWREDKQKGPNGYFRVCKNNGSYNFGWCPLDVCPTCKPKCSSVGLLDVNGGTLLPLDGGGAPPPVTFRRLQTIA